MADRTGGRHTGFKAVSTGRSKQQAKPTIFPISLDGDLCKTQLNDDNVLRFSSVKLDFPIDSRLRGNDRSGVLVVVRQNQDLQDYGGFTRLRRCWGIILWILP